MKNLNKPLGVKGKKLKAGEEDRSFAERLLLLPYGWASMALLVTVAFSMVAWIAVVDDPNGGEPIVSVQVTEPRFDDTERSVEVVALAPKTKLDPEKTPSIQTLDGVEEIEIQDVEPINPDDILIYDPTAEARKRQSVRALSTVADKALLEKSRHGFLPKIGSSGEKSFIAYSRPVTRSRSRTGRIAIVVGGLGLNKTISQKVLADLPPTTTLAFAPYGDGLLDWMARARKRGHELLLQIPMEPFDYPNNDPGPRTLLVDAEWAENEDKLHWIMSRMTNYVGVMNYLGARFSASPESMTPLLNELRDRGLLYVDDGSTPLSRARELAETTKTAYAQSSLVLDNVLEPDDIDARLLELETLARDRGSAIGVISAFPLSIERLKRWAESAEKRGIDIVPITATLDKSSF